MKQATDFCMGSIYFVFLWNVQMLRLFAYGSCYIYLFIQKMNWTLSAKFLRTALSLEHITAKLFKIKIWEFNIYRNGPDGNFFGSYNNKYGLEHLLYNGFRENHKAVSCSTFTSFKEACEVLDSCSSSSSSGICTVSFSFFPFWYGCLSTVLDYIWKDEWKLDLVSKRQ